MSEILMPRRGFITGIAALVAAPAIVRADSLMPLRSTPVRPDYLEIVALNVDGSVGRCTRLVVTKGLRNLGLAPGRIVFNPWSLNEYDTFWGGFHG